MRFHLLAAIVMAGAALPAMAQDDRTDRRVEKLEQEIRALQRRVFQGAVQPEIAPGVRTTAADGVPASSPVADISARLDALEGQLAALTGQSEENANRVRQLEQALARLMPRLDALERSAAPVTAPQPQAAAPAPVTTRTAAAAAPADPPATASSAAPDPAETAYNAGFRLWDQKRYPEAQRALEAMARTYPRHRLASWASNLAGRAYLDEGKPASAAKIFLANYQGNPRGERAADSLYFLGQALARLDKLTEACKVYDELQDVYGTNMRAFLRQSLPAARTAARCR